MSPGDIADRNFQRRSQPLAVGWTGRVVAGDNGFHQLNLQRRIGGQPLNAHSSFTDVMSDGLHGVRDIITKNAAGDSAWPDSLERGY